jgi:hypothetical protein
VAFGSCASNLVAGDTNVSDIFVHDRVTGITERVSVDSSGAQANGGSDHPSISADGQVVTFDSWASNLVFGDTNGLSDIFVHDRVTGITERMSVDSSGAEANSESWPPSISADGQVVAFGSGASNLVAGDTNGWFDVFVHERATGITERVSVDSSGAEGNRDSRWPSISVDGQVVAFHSDASNLVAGDSNSTTDVFVHDRATAITERASVDSTGTEANSISGGSSISADGQVVAFYGSASNLVAGDTNGAYDVFVHEYCLTTASWTNYGSGFLGTNGIPSLTSQQNPSFGATITVTLDNSYGAPTFGFLVVGFQRGSFHMKSGGCSSADHDRDDPLLERRRLVHRHDSGRRIPVRRGGRCPGHRGRSRRGGRAFVLARTGARDWELIHSALERARRRPLRPRISAPERGCDSLAPRTMGRSERLSVRDQIGSPSGTEVRTALGSSLPLGCPSGTRTGEVRTWEVLGNERYGDSNLVISG